MAFTTNWGPAGPYVTFTTGNGLNGNGYGSARPNYQGLLDDSIAASRDQAAAAVGSAQGGVGAILGRSGDVDAAVGSMRGAADSMIPIAGDLRGHGNAMFDSGTKVTEQALETLGTGLGFINMDSSASPLVAESLRLYGEFDPDKYVASAKQDVQSQYDNVRGQQARALARQGVSPGSGAALANERELSKAQATALASAMQRARERGLTDQATQFQNLVTNNANTFLQTGGQLASIGSSMRSAGASALGNAGNVLQGAGTLYGNAGKLSLDFGNSLAGAYDALAGVQMNQAKNTISGEAERVRAINGDRRYSGGVNVIDNTNHGKWRDTGTFFRT